PRSSHALPGAQGDDRLGRRPLPAVSRLLIANLYFRTRLQTKLAFGHHDFPALKTLIDHHILIDARARLDRAYRYAAIFTYDIDVGSVLARLDGLIRNHHCVVASGQPQPDVHELTGP